MTTVLFIHSAGLQNPGEGSFRFLEGFRAALPADLVVEAPLMPKPDGPDADAWLAAFHQHLQSVEGELALVGHSLGGSTILQGLARFGVPEGLRGVVTLAAPFWGEGGWGYEDFALPPDAEERLAGLPKLVMLLGTEDETVEANHLQLYTNLLPQAETATLPGVDHEAADAGPEVARRVLQVLGRTG